MKRHIYFKRGSRGIALPMALVLMVVGAFLIVPVMVLLGTNLKMDTMVKQETTGVYAADAGVYDYVWRLKNLVSENITDPLDEVGDEYAFSDANGMTVTVKNLAIDEDNNLRTIEAVTTDNGTVVGRVVAQIEFTLGLDLDFMLDNAITSNGDVTIMPGSNIDGDVLYVTDIYGNLKQSDIDGTTTPDPDGIDGWPTCEEMTEFYWESLQEEQPYTTYPDGTIIDISSGTLENPVEIGPAYVEGNVQIKTYGDEGYCRLVGTIFCVEDEFGDGLFEVMPNATLDLNDQTIFSSCYNEGEDVIYFQPGSYLIGSGCVIACGDINFQPNMSGDQGDLIIGDNTLLSDGNGSINGDNFRMVRLQAATLDDTETTHSLQKFKVYSSSARMVNIAVYADNSGNPGTLLGASADDIVDGGYDVESGWYMVTLDSGSCDITEGEYYWLAITTSDDNAEYNDQDASCRYKSATFNGFAFPDPAASGFTSLTDRTYLLSGYDSYFIVIMSIDGKSTIKPNGSFCGSIIGNSEVYLYPGTSLTWVNPDDEGINFPFEGAGGEEQEEGVALIRSYSVQKD